MEQVGLIYFPAKLCCKVKCLGSHSPTKPLVQGDV